MKKRINDCFERCRRENRQALIAYVTVGCPSPEESEKLISRLIEAGADMIELGVPFSDPMADGPVIQKSGQLALKAGITLDKVLGIASRIRAEYPDTPLILFSYCNVLFNYGYDRLGEAMQKAGIDGLLAVDLPFEERHEILPMCEKYHLDLIPLISPATSQERAAEITANASGFVYYITVRGVTGMRNSLPPDLADGIEALKKVCHLPVAAGFGISSPEMAETVAAHSHGIIIGSAVMNTLMNTGADAAVKLISDIAGALRRK